MMYEKEFGYWTVCKHCNQEMVWEGDSDLAGLIVGRNCTHCGHILLLRVDGESRIHKKTDRLHLAIFETFMEQDLPITLRQLYYALTVKGAIPKTEAAYRKVATQTANMRKNGQMPYYWFADSTRYFLKPTTYNGLETALERWQQAYRRDLWQNQNAYVEIWIEKDALRGVISPITNAYDVRLYSARGYSSLTFIYEAAEQIKQIGKPTYIYHFGDFDPSGQDAALKLKEGLEGHGVDIHFEQVAITLDQINKYNLPTRPTKKKDSRAKTWGNLPSVELDAMPSRLLKQLVEDVITRHIDPWELERSRHTEEMERHTLQQMIDNFGLVQK